MATISHSDLAPDEAVTYSLASAEPFTLEGAATYEVAEPDEEAGDDRAAYDALISNAKAHPWLTVEVAAPDPDADPAVLAVDFPRTAIDAGLDQKVAQYEGEASETPTAETLAADEEQGDEPIIADDAPDDGEND